MPMLKPFLLVLSLSLATTVVQAQISFDESYEDELTRKRIEKELKKAEIIPPEVSGKIQAEHNNKIRRDVKNQDVYQRNVSVQIMNHINKEKDPNYKPVAVDVKSDEKMRAFYDENFKFDVSEILYTQPVSEEAN
ncbi:MAG: hypothetical protein PHE89_06525 [Alphaproteobacteria bacterium]|nr:hypothetical protein [Alphaproteobacteria bacterium]